MEYNKRYDLLLKRQPNSDIPTFMNYLSKYIKDKETINTILIRHKLYYRGWFRLMSISLLSVDNIIKMANYCNVETDKPIPSDFLTGWIDKRERKVK